MEKAAIRSLFGLTHAEMAMLLGISSSHYSMYESGKRGIPLAARQILNELLAHRQSNKVKLEPKQDPGAMKASLQKHVNYLLHENEYQRMKLAREIAAVERKQAKMTGMLLLQNFSSARESAGLAKEAVSRIPLRSKTAKAAGKDLEVLLMQLRLKQEMLEAEHRFLASKLKSGEEAAEMGKPS